MAIINYVRRKDLLNAGLSNSELIHLFQRCEYFRNRKEETSIYLQFDVLMIFIALELSTFLSLRNVSETISDLTKHFQNLFKLLKKNKKQFLVVEKKTDTEMVTNVINGDISFTYKEALFRGLSSHQFSKALKELHRLGFIDIQKPGSALKGDWSQFTFSDRWREFKTPNFKNSD